ncbi:hypothetical protein CDD80_2096 [Ophiocordyceps camponoti-rufipedis]|uniref:Uncharacterized protein n=1 Tax=Ophiocordyceps camponoti-rufipedis TaxID=2004952 RepID=A0A2C5ZP76_9HYPO|nr:hypothetical protein CDD80_2096 [Ophiocordyceps camponoti-rufipedis]
MNLTETQMDRITDAFTRSVESSPLKARQRVQVTPVTEDALLSQQNCGLSHEPNPFISYGGGGENTYQMAARSISDLNSERQRQFALENLAERRQKQTPASLQSTVAGACPLRCFASQPPPLPSRSGLLLKKPTSALAKWIKEAAPLKTCMRKPGNTRASQPQTPIGEVVGRRTNTLNNWKALQTGKDARRTAEFQNTNKRLQPSAKETHGCQVQISLDPREQSLLYCELEYHLTTALNDFITAELEKGHLVPDNLKQVSDAWANRGRPKVIGFRYDLETQLQLVSLHVHDFEFHGRRQSSPSEIGTLLGVMKSHARQMRLRTFCQPDFVIAKELVDSQSLFNLIDVSRVQQLALAEASQFFEVIVEREKVTQRVRTIVVPPQSPFYVRLPNTPQVDESRPPRVRGHLPIPRDIFPRAERDRKIKPQYIQKVAPQATNRREARSASQQWKEQMADSRRKNLKESLGALWDRRARSDKVRKVQVKRKLEANERAAAAPERDDDRYTRTTVNQALLDTKTHPDEDRVTRAANSRMKLLARESAKREARRHALTELYISASNFIINVKELEEEIERLFCDEYFKKTISEANRHGMQENVWGVYGKPPSISDMLSETSGYVAGVKDYNAVEYGRSVERHKRITEDLTGGRMP